MKVKVRFLANYRELVGSSEKLLELDDGAAVGAMLDVLYQEFPRLGEHRDEVLISVNKKQAPLRQGLHDGDEIVLLPPAVGG
jgi:MoaD family protein